jgi:hypothetical protein
MVKTFLPLAKSPITTPDLWSKTARNWLATGVIKAYLNEFQVYADSTGMQVKVKSGAANVLGIYFDSDAEEILAIAAANADNPRIDRIIVRLDLPADNIDLAVLQGTPAASPTAPALTQNNTRWEISLAQVYVGANVSTIAAVNVTDERIYAKSTPYLFRTISGINYGATNVLQQINASLGSGVQNDLTFSGSNIVINTAGTYEIEVDADISGLNQNILYELFIRVYKDGVGYGDYGHNQRGINATAGLNYDTVWSYNKIKVYIVKGGWIQFFVRIGESPRSINDVVINITRIGD